MAMILPSFFCLLDYNIQLDAFQRVYTQKQKYPSCFVKNSSMIFCLYYLNLNILQINIFGIMMDCYIDIKLIDKFREFLS